MKTKLDKYLNEKKGIPGKTVEDKLKYAIDNDIKLTKSDFKWLSNRMKDMDSNIGEIRNAIINNDSGTFFISAFRLKEFYDVIFLDGIKNMLNKKKIK